MKSRGGPPGNGNGARQSADPKTEKLARKCRTSLAFVNTDRKLLGSRDGVLLTNVSSGRLVAYEVEQGSKCWRYGLLFQAQGKFERLTKEGRRLS
jgi:hypothetical protein